MVGRRARRPRTGDSELRLCFEEVVEAVVAAFRAYEDSRRERRPSEVRLGNCWHQQTRLLKTENI